MINEQLPEIILIQKAKTDPIAFELLYQRYSSRIFQYLRLRCTSNEDASDLTQYVFQQAFTALPKYKERNLPFAAWLFRIARNAATDNFRRNRESISWEFLPLALHPITDQEPEALILQQERREQLRNLLTRLNTEKRELLTLRFAADLSVVEIAITIGKSEAAVRKQLTRILASLKKQYEERYNDK